MSDPYFPSLKDIMTAEHTLNDILVRMLDKKQNFIR